MGKGTRLVLGVLLALLFTFSQGKSLSNVQAEGSYLSEGEVRNLLCQPWLNWNCEEMVWIAYRESRWKTDAINYDCYPWHINPQTGSPYICAGLLQVIETNVDYWPSLLNPVQNVVEAYRIWVDSKGTAWQ